MFYVSCRRIAHRIHDARFTGETKRDTNYKRKYRNEIYVLFSIFLSFFFALLAAVQCSFGIWSKKYFGPLCRFIANALMLSISLLVLICVTANSSFASLKFKIRMNSLIVWFSLTTFSPIPFAHGQRTTWWGQKRRLQQKQNYRIRTKCIWCWWWKWKLYFLMEKFLRSSVAVSVWLRFHIT